MQALEIIYPELKSAIEKRRTLKNRICIIPFENITQKENGTNKIDESKLKKEILDFIKTQETIQKLFGIIFQ